MTTIYKPVAELHRQMMKRVAVQDGGCWIFTGCTVSTGYGCVGAGRSGKTILTHRLAVLHRDGGIPEGMTVDHSCHDSHECQDVPCIHRRCVNPDHLRVMSVADNTRRQWESGLCRRGHLLHIKRSNGKRYCAECEAEKRRKRNGNTSSNYWAMKRGELPRPA